MTDQYDFDHVSVAVSDAPAAAASLRSELGAIPVIGGVFEEFRYVLTHVGTVDRGARLELISPSEAGRGFINRFLLKHGQAAHHLCFLAPNLRMVREQLHESGFSTVKEDLDYPRWQELFLPTDRTHNIVIQVASSIAEFPTDAEILATRERDFASMPNNRGVQAPDWWQDMWNVPVDHHAVLGPTVLNSTDMKRSELLFGEILGGQPESLADSAATVSQAAEGAETAASPVLYRWPSGSIIVQPTQSSGGVQHVIIERGKSSGIRIGDVNLISTPASVE